MRFRRLVCREPSEHHDHHVTTSQHQRAPNRTCVRCIEYSTQLGSNTVIEWWFPNILCSIAIPLNAQFRVNARGRHIADCPGRPEHILGFLASEKGSCDASWRRRQKCVVCCHEVRFLLSLHAYACISSTVITLTLPDELGELLALGLYMKPYVK